MNNSIYLKQAFEVESGTIVTTDLEPAVSIDHNERLVQGISSLVQLLGITEMTPAPVGSNVKIYKYKKTLTPEQVDEGEKIGLTEYQRKLDRTIELKLSKYRKKTTAEAIQRVGRGKAVDDTDVLLRKDVQKDVKKRFMEILSGSSGSGPAPVAPGLQAALAAAWGVMADYFSDYDVEPVYFVNPVDVANYLATAQVTVQNTFGFKYVQDFLGLGTVFIDPAITQGHVLATAKENLRGVYVPASGDVAQTFGLTADSTGLVGMTHYISGNDACIETLVISGVLIYVEDASGVTLVNITKDGE